jgi:hypothetical protein
MGVSPGALVTVGNTTTMGDVVAVGTDVGVVSVGSSVATAAEICGRLVSGTLTAPVSVEGTGVGVAFAEVVLAALTVTVQEAFLPVPFSVAVILALPTDLAFTLPLAVTEATAFREVVHFTFPD